MIFRKSINYLARKFLYLWVRSDALSPFGETLNTTTDHPVVYVLEHRSWSNLLVLEQECTRLGFPLPLSRISSEAFKSWHSVYTVAPRLPFKAWLQGQPKRSRMLRGMLELINEDPELDVQFVPVSIFWGRPVSKQKSWIRILFADSWRLAGRTRKIFTILFNGRQTLVKFSEPLSYRARILADLSDDENVDRIQQSLSESLIDMRSATLGPDVSHRRTLVREILQIPAIKDAMGKRQQEDNLTEYRVALQARRYLYEIVADCTSITIQILQKALTSFWNKFYSGIEVTHSAELKRLALTHELVYVPCHRSHIDYLLLSYVIHAEGLVIPYIAAGKNLNMPIIGSILRSAGAFFIRRSFKGNELYSKLMFEYVAMLLSQGMPIEYFIEGGRSRTGRLLMPKPGMLAMTIRGFLKYRKKPIAFIPVFIAYEKMIEGKAYIAELLGSKKQKENLFSTIKSIANLRGEFGKVTTSFGEPILLNNILEKHHTGWQGERYQEHDRPLWIRDTVTDTAQKIMTAINCAAAANATNLVSVALLSSPNKHMDEAQLGDLLELFSGLLDTNFYSKRISVTNLSGQEQIARVEDLGMVKRRKHALGDIMFVNDKLTGLLSYYRNNVLHLFAVPSLVACCFLNRQTMTRKKMHKLVSLVYPFVQRELFLPWGEEQLSDVLDSILEFFVERNLLQLRKNTDSFVKPVAGTLEYVHLEQLCGVILPILETYYMVLMLLIRNDEKQLGLAELEQSCFLTVQRISLLHQQSAVDFMDRNLVKNFISALVHMEYLDDSEDSFKLNDKLLSFDKDARLLLSAQMRTSMLHILK